jgi:hypothetical protein
MSKKKSSKTGKLSRSGKIQTQDGIADEAIELIAEKASERSVSIKPQQHIDTPPIHHESLSYNNELDKRNLEEYFSCMNFNRYSDKPLVNKLLSDIKVNRSAVSHITNGIKPIYYLVNPSKVGTIVTCFKAESQETTAVYGILMSEVERGEIVHKYICTGPTFISQDGEYRHRIITIHQYEQFRKIYSDIIEEIDNMITSWFESGGVKFHVFPFMPELYPVDQSKHLEMIDTDRFAIRLFSLCWLYDYYNIYKGTMENHLYPGYQFIIYQEDQRDFFLKLLNKVGEDNYISIKGQVTRIGTDITPVRISDSGGNTLMTLSHEAGIKFFPIITTESLEVDNINYPVWRELYFTRQATDLIINFNTPALPAYHKYIYGQHAHAGLFDNMSQLIKYQNSRIGDELIKLIHNADSVTYNQRKRELGYIHPEFKHISRTLHDEIKYAEDHIVLRDVVVGMVMQHTGKTLKDHLTYIENYPPEDQFHQLYHSAYTVDEYSIKHIFECIYTAHCLHTKLGIVHGDIHINNITMQYNYFEYDPASLSPHIYYRVTDKLEMLFPHNGLWGTIIDFSRSYCNNRTKLEEDFDMPTVEIFMQDQKKKVIGTLSKYFPKYVEKNRQKLKSLAKNNFDLLFKIFTTLDAYTISRSWLSLYENDIKSHGIVTAPPNAIILARNVMQRAEKDIIGLLTDAYDGKITSADQIEYPTIAIIADIFSAFVYTKKVDLKDKDIVDAYDATLPLKYSISAYATMPNMLRLDTDIELKKKFNLSVSDDLAHLNNYLRNETKSFKRLIGVYKQTHIPDVTSSSSI